MFNQFTLIMLITVMISLVFSVKNYLSTILYIELMFMIMIFSLMNKISFSNNWLMFYWFFSLIILTSICSMFCLMKNIRNMSKSSFSFMYD